MDLLACMYVTLAPVIFAGILNMIWCKLPILSFIRKPIDGGVILSDGKRLFGDNKTWKGLLGYLLLNTLCTILWGILCKTVPPLLNHNWFYMQNANTLTYNLLVGMLLGLAYSLFELPNSFMKRRLDISPGKTLSGFWKVFFIFFDQADSLFGCVLVVCIFHHINIALYLLYVAVGAATHIIINILLYFAHLRRNMF